MISSPILYCQVYLNPGGINMIKDKNGKDLTEAEEIKKSSKTTQKNCTKNILMTWMAMMVWSLT